MEAVTETAAQEAPAAEVVAHRGGYSRVVTSWIP